MQGAIPVESAIFTRFIGESLAVSCLRDVDVARVFNPDLPKVL
jgi:hypothetical protein